MNKKAVLFVLLCSSHGCLLAQEKTQIDLDASISPKTVLSKEIKEIYEVALNQSWFISTLATIDEENVYIPLKYIPSDLLGNLVESNFVVKNNEKQIKINNKLINKRDDEKLILEINLDESFFKNSEIITNKEKIKESTPINAFYTNYSATISGTDLTSVRSIFDSNWSSKDNWIFKNQLLWNGQTLLRMITSICI